MNTRTKHSLKAVIEHRVLVKVLLKNWVGFFCMNEPYLRPNKLGNECQERLLLIAHIYI